MCRDESRCNLLELVLGLMHRSSFLFVSWQIIRLHKESRVVPVVSGAPINNEAVLFGSSPDLRFRPACPLTVRRAFEGQELTSSLSLVSDGDETRPSYSYLPRGARTRIASLIRLATGK